MRYCVVMDIDLIRKASYYKNNGANFYFRRNHFGSPKIKIKYGPFKLLTKRFETDIETFGKIKNICGSMLERK